MVKRQRDLEELEVLVERNSKNIYELFEEYMINKNQLKMFKTEVAYYKEVLDYAVKSSNQKIPGLGKEVIYSNGTNQKYRLPERIIDDLNKIGKIAGFKEQVVKKDSEKLYFSKNPEVYVAALQCAKDKLSDIINNNYN